MTWDPPLSGNTAVLGGNACSRNCMTSWTRAYQHRRRGQRGLSEALLSPDRTADGQWEGSRGDLLVSSPSSLGATHVRQVRPEPLIHGRRVLSIWRIEVQLAHPIVLRRRQLLPTGSLRLVIRQPDLSAEAQMHLPLADSVDPAPADSPYPANIALRLVHHDVQTRSLLDFRSSEGVYYLLEGSEAG